MKFLVILYAAAVVVGASRPSRSYDNEYRDYPPYFDSGPHAASRPSFLTSYSKYKSFRGNPKSFKNDAPVFGDGSPSRYHEERIPFDSFPPANSYFMSHRPESHYHHRPSNFQETELQEYRGPPPPLPNNVFQAHSASTTDERLNNLLELQTTTETQDQNEQYVTPIHRQPLSFGGHANHLNYGNHGLGFASVAAVTSPDINPLAIAESAATTKADPMITMHSTSAGTVQISQQQLTTSPTNVKMSTPVVPLMMPPSTPLPNTAATSSQPLVNTESKVKVPESTTLKTATKPTLAISKPNLEPTMNQPPPSHVIDVTMMLHKPEKSEYEFRTVSEKQPLVMHGHLSIEPPAQQLPVTVNKPNVFYYEMKTSVPLQELEQQIQQAHSNGNVAPIRIDIPTTLIPASFSTVTNTPVSVKFQDMNLSQIPLNLAAVPNTNTFIPGQNQIDLLQFQKHNAHINAPINAPINTGHGLPAFFSFQGNEEAKYGPQINSNVPLGSFVLLQNDKLKQPTQHNQFNSGIPTGLQLGGLQLGGFDGIELLSPFGNAERMRPAIVDIGKIGFSLH